MMLIKVRWMMIMKVRLMLLMKVRFVNHASAAAGRGSEEKGAGAASEDPKGGMLASMGAVGEKGLW